VVAGGHIHIYMYTCMSVTVNGVLTKWLQVDMCIYIFIFIYIRLQPF